MVTARPVMAKAAVAEETTRAALVRAKRVMAEVMEKRMAVPVVKATEEVPAAAMQDVAMIEDAGRMEAAMARR